MSQESDVTELDLAQRNIALTRVRELIANESSDEQARHADVRFILASLAVPFAPACAETVSRTVANLGVALYNGIVPDDLHRESVRLVTAYLSQAEKYLITSDWRAQIAMRLGSLVLSQKVEPALCDHIALTVINYVFASKDYSEPIEHSIEFLFLATLESEALGDEYAQTICTALLDNLATSDLPLPMLARVLSCAAHALVNRRMPGGMATDIIAHVIANMPAFKVISSPHYDMMAWALSQALAMEVAENIEISMLETFSVDPDIEESFRVQIENNITLTKMNGMLRVLELQASSTPVAESTADPELDEMLTNSLMRNLLP